MIIDGRAIAQKVLAAVKMEVDSLAQMPRLTVFTCAPNFETQKFLALKEKRAAEVGIAVEVISLDPAILSVEVIRLITEKLTETDAVVVQLPFPLTVDMGSVLAAIPTTYDVDALQYQGESTAVLPPVVGAIAAISQHHQISWKDKQVVVVGQGRLVGGPATLFAVSAGANVTVVAADTPGREDLIAHADILILGAGVPNLITADMVKPGVVVFDAGTSEAGGLLVGDAAAGVADKAALITPVPGGIGPITIAILLQNVLKLVQSRSKNEVNVL